MTDQFDTAAAVAGYLQSRKPEEAVRTSMTLAAGANPDAEAEYKRLAREAGIPVDSVRDNKDAVKQQVSAPDYDELAAKFPSTTQYLSTLDNARIAHDDVGNLTAIEDAVRKLGGAAVDVGKYAVSAPGSLGGGLLSDVARGGRILASGFGPGLGAGAYEAAAAPLELLGLDKAGGFLRDQAAQSRMVRDYVAPPPGADAGTLERGVYSGLQSAGQNLAVLPLGFAAQGERLLLGALGVITAGQSYGKARDQGLSPARAIPYAVQDATAEVITERFLGAAGFLQQIKAGASAGKLFMYELAKEVPGEMAATLWQNFNEWTNLNPEKSVADFVQEQPAALAETVIATLVGGTAQIGAVKAVEKAMGRMAKGDGEAQRAEQSATRAQEFAGLIEQSKLRERDPEAFKQFVAEVSDSGNTPTEFYIDAQQLANSLNQSAISIEQLRAFAPAVADQMEAAQHVPGADIRVPLAEFAATPSNITAGLIDHLRENPEAMSRAEAQSFLKGAGANIQKEVETALTSETQNAETSQALEQMRQGFQNQLDAAGKFRPEVNKAYASLLTNFYAAQAERTGKTLPELAQQYGLHVAGKEGAGAQQLEQNDPMASRKDVVGKSQGGRSADDKTSGAARKLSQATFSAGKAFISQIESLAEQHGSVYVRWSPTSARDLSGPQNSRDFVAGTTHDGLSAVEITGDMHPVDIAKRVSEYGFLRMQDARSVPRVYLGDRVGTDSDGYALIKPKRLLEEASLDVLRAIDAGFTKALDLEDSIQTDEARLRKITDPVAREITQSSLDEARKKLSEILPNESPAPDSGGANTPNQGEAAFRRSEAIGNGLPLEKAQKVVGELMAGWKNGPQVTVVPTHRDLPIPAPRDVRGLYFKGKVWVVAGAHADSMQVRQTVGRTLAHEAIAHYGLREMLGREGWAELMGKIQSALPDNKELQKIQSYIRRAYVDEKGQFDLSPNLEADEIAARVVEQAIDKNGQFKPGFEFVKSVYAKIADFLRGLGIDVKFTTAELHGMLVLAQRGLEVGKRAEGGGQVMVAAARTEEGQAARGELNQDSTEAFKKWFGDESTLRNADGSPMVLYHGTGAKGFTTFKRSASGAMGPAVYLGDDREVAMGYKPEKGGRIMEVYARGKYLTNMQWTDYVNKHGWEGAEAAATADGWSGIHDTMMENAIAVWNPKDIKSAVGNRGTFDSSDPNILHQPSRGVLSFADDITASPSVIALLENADLSTFLHESGHFFLEVQADLVARIQGQINAGASVSDGERGIVADMDRILTWLGVKGTAQQSALSEWLSMTLEQKRDHHETWARGFERYLMEGKAPSQELQALFSKFRSWLVSVYKTLTGLNVSLTDDVRQVMDRMLASDQAITEARDERAMGPLFQSPEAAGMTAAEYADYQALAERSAAQASAELDARLMKDMKWLSRARDKALKARQAEVDEMRMEIEREVRADVMSRPVYQAWQFLTGKGLRVEPGIQAAETIDTVRQSGKLRTSFLKETHPQQWKTLSERHMTSDTNGMDPDIVADIIPGFSSGDELVQALAAAPSPQTVIEELTDRQMLETHGDIASPQALAQAADEAVHNELRARIVATELQAMEKANNVKKGARSTINVMARAAKEYAYQVIAGQRVRDLRPSQYSAAQARSAKLAQQALGKSTQEAAMHKRNELINGYATTAAYEAQAEVKAAQAYFRKFDKRVKSIDAGYQDQIEQLLERFDFKPASLKEIDKRKSFAAWYAEQKEAGLEPNVPEQLLESAGKQSFKDMTVEELRGLRDTIKQIEHQGRLKNRLLLARDQREFDTVAAEMVASIVAHGGKARPVNLEGPNPVADLFAGVAASHRKLASLFRQMDGNKDHGPMYENIGRAMNERGTMEDVMLEKATMALRDLYAPLLKMRGGITGYRSKLFIPEINASLTRGGRLAVALNWGNEANRQRIMDGDRWGDGQVRAILKTLTPAELEFVNGVWAYLDSYWDEIAAKEKRLTGVEPEKVEALPFTAIASDGTAVAMRGGYYPLKYDTDRSDRADTHEAAQAAKEMMQGVVTRATTRRGHTKERLKEVKRAVRKDLNVITQHVTQVVHDLAWHEWLIDTNKFLSDEGVVAAIRAHYGPKVLKSMRDDVLGIATADATPMTDIDKAMLMMRSNVSRATMGASLTTAFLQPFGLTQSIVRIGGRHVLRGMARWGGDAMRMENTIGWINGKSDFMRLRAKTFNRELREIRGSVAGKSKTMQVVDGGLFVLMQKMQMVADVPTWVGQYEKSTAQGLDEASAVAMADRAVLESQGGGQTKDLAEVQRKHPMLTQFYSYFSVTLNLAAESTAATNFKNAAAVAGWLGDMALLMVIPAIIPSLLMFALKGGGGDDDKAMLRRIAEWQLGYLMGTVVGIRELAGAVSGFDYAGPPVGRIIGDLGKAGKQTLQGEIDEPAVMAYINLMGSAFGIPTVQAMRSYKGWKAWDEGQDGAGPQSLFFGPPPKD